MGDADKDMSGWPDLSGRIVNGRHILPLRVYFEDTDFTGFVYHAAYVRWFERGRSDFVRLLGVHHDDLANPEDGSEPKAFVVRHLEVDYLKPAHIDQVLEVHTYCAEIGGAVLLLHQEIRRGEVIVAKANVKVVLISHSGKPQRIDSLPVDAFTSLQTDP